MTVLDSPPAAPQDDRAARRRLLALLGVLALVAAALSLGLRGGDEPAPLPAGPSAEELADLRADAALAPCPAGLGGDLPDLVLPCLGGGPDVALSAAAPGRPVLVNVWASWCGPCVEEVPVLAEVSARAGDRLGLVGVLHQDTPASALTFAATSGMRWPSVVDDQGEVLRAYSGGLPATLFVTADGDVVHVERGEVTSVAELEALVAAHLGVSL